MLDEEKAAAPPTTGNNSSDQLEVAKPPKRTIFSRFNEELDPKFVYLPLLVCCFATGLTDGTLYNGS